MSEEPEADAADAKPPAISEEDRQRYRDYCQTESDGAYASITKNQEEYDKQLLTLSTGLLAVLVAFLKDIVHLDLAAYLSLLYISLTSLVLSVFSVLTSFQVSNHVLEQVRIYWRKRYEEELDYPFPERGGKIIKVLNMAGGILFAIGVLFAVMFIIFNLSKQSMRALK